MLQCEVAYARKTFAIPASKVIKPGVKGQYIALWVPVGIFIAIMIYVAIKVYMYNKLHDKFHSLNEALVDQEAWK